MKITEKEVLIRSVICRSDKQQLMCDFGHTPIFLKRDLIFGLLKITLWY